MLKEIYKTQELSKTFQTDVDQALRGKEVENFSTECSINVLSGEPYMHTSTRCSERLIQTLEGLLLANLEETQNLEEKLSFELKMMMRTKHKIREEKPFQMHYGTNLRALLTIQGLPKRHYCQIDATFVFQKPQ